jgi:hypothetical protein
LIFHKLGKNGGKMRIKKKNKDIVPEIQKSYVFETREDLVEWIRNHLSINADMSYNIQDYYGEGQRVEIKVDICENVDAWTTRRGY